MEYKELSKVYYQAPVEERDAVLERKLAARLGASSSYVLDFRTECGQLFIATPREMTTLLERILRRERKITKLMQQLPGIAGDEVLRGLVFDEVISSNAIEDIHSTRKQIESALLESARSRKNRRFREFARLYLDMTFSHPALPQSPEDIRAVYDRIMDGEELDEPPDGKLFRKDQVFISNGLKQVHVGICPEEKIIDAMNRMLEIAHSEDMPSVYGALAAHYVFEYAHPFYDGNGRTGRYLLSLFLENSLSKPTALSLSRVIARNKGAYYNAFKVAENVRNHGELTFFVFSMLELIMDAQDELIERLERGNERYRQIAGFCKELKGFEYKDKELSLIFALAQQAEFGMFKDAPLDLLAEMVNLGTQQTRKYLGKLADAGVVEKVRGRSPITFALTDGFLQDHFADSEGIGNFWE